MVLEDSMEREFIAFISYRHAALDSAAAKTLHTMIEQYRVPRDLQPGGKRKLGLVFRDQEELHASSDLSAEIQEALANSEYLIVICSENTVDSPWVSREIGHFLENHDRDHILTVLASGEPMEVFPEILTHVQQPDGSVKIVEPLALDIREKSPSAMRRKLRREIPRLIAAMLDCPYDALVLREQRRKFRRFAAAAALILAVVLAFTSVVVAKNREIADKNTELARQKAEIQLRESELLTQDAREALEAGNYLGAIEDASAALPKPEDADRPYYAPAEGVLMDALNVFHTKDEEVILSHRDLTQVTEINGFSINADGSRLVTTDDYGTYTCFDTASSQIIWQTTIPGTSYGNTVLIDDGLNLAFTLIGNTLAALDLDTGAIAWQRTGNFVLRYLFIHPESKTLVYIAEEWQGQHRHYLIFADAETGEERSTLLLNEHDSLCHCEFYNSYTPGLSVCGVFSDDGSRFFGTFVDNDSDSLHCFRADLTTGSCEIIYQHPATGMYETGTVKLVLTDQTLRIAATGMVDYAAMSFLEIDQASGALLRQWDVMPEDYNYATPFAFFFDTFAIFALYDQMILLDLETGETLDQVQFYDQIMQLQMVDNRLCFCLADGTCGLAWVNANWEFTLSNDTFFNVSADLGPLRSAQVWGHGIIQLYIEGDSFAFGVSNMVGPGYAAVIPSDAENTIRIFQPILLESPTTLHPLLWEEASLSARYDCGIQRCGDLLFVGPVEITDPAIGEDQDYYLIVNGQTLQVEGRICMPEDVYTSSIFLLPDGSGLMEVTYEDITLWDQDGNRKDTLALDDLNYIPYGEDFLFVGNAVDSAAGYVADGTKLVTALCDTDTLSLQINAQPPQKISLPDHLVYDPVTQEFRDRFLHIGENGCILVCLYSDYESICISEAAIYDIASDTWTVCSGDAVFASESKPAFAKKLPLFALVDLDGNLRIYDTASGSEVSTISLQTPANSVSQLEFLLDDSCILIQNDDGMIFIYDIASGTLHFRGQSPGYASLTICPDSKNQRLYLLDADFSEHKGLCLDLRSWSVLTQLNYALYFDADTDLIFCDMNLFLQEPELTYFQVPTTKELVETAQNLMN